MYKFRNESWVQKVLRQDNVDDWTTSSEKIGYFHTKRDPLHWRKAVENVEQKINKQNPSIEDRQALGTLNESGLTWTGPWNYNAKDNNIANKTYLNSTIYQTTYGKIGQNTTDYKLLNRNGVRLEPIDSTKLSTVSEMSSMSLNFEPDMSSSGKSTLKPLGSSIADGLKINSKKRVRKGIKENRVFSFKYRNGWNFSPRPN